jgi:tetratricopeptide (TPR) repeat protein
MRKAYELRERVSERERLYIDSHYQIFVTGNLEAARKADELLVQTYPRDTSITNLGLLYSELGDYEKALFEYKEFLRVNHATGGRYANLVSGYLQLNRPDEAKAVAREALAHNIESPELHLNLYWVDFLEHDATGMEREAGRLLGKPGYEDQMLSFESDAAVNGGQLIKARALTRRAVESAKKWDEEEPPALYQAEAAVHEALVGNTNFAKQRAQAAIALSNGKDVEALSAIALAMVGDSAQARRMADDLGKRFPEDTIVQSNYLPVIRASVFLNGGEFGSAIEALAAAAPHELGGNLETMNFVFYPVYMRGKAYLAAKQGPTAAAEFQKILTHPGALRSEPIGALAQLGLARAWDLTGEKAKAKTAYQDFLTLWKDADPDVPVFREAIAEYSKLQ